MLSIFALYISLEVPVPQVNITPNHTAPLYVGTGLTLTCTATIKSNITWSSDKVITAQWSGPKNISEEIYIFPPPTLSGKLNAFKLIISPLQAQDSGMYTCTVTLTICRQFSTANMTVAINVLCK